MTRRLGTAGAGACLVLTACYAEATQEFSSSLPLLTDWVDCGTILVPGGEGEWDRFLWGGFAFTVVKRDSLYFLYYQGSDGFDDDRGTVTNRAIGLAISRDGLSYTKHAHNPVLSFSPNGNVEEGAVSSAVYVAETGAVMIYYGANTWIGGDNVAADVRLAVSDDGIRFSDRGVVLAHDDRTVWGYGDELFPLLALRHGGMEILYYVPNGTRQRGQLGAAWTRADAAAPFRTARASGPRGPVRVWGPGSVTAFAQSGGAALFLTSDRDGRAHLEVRTMSTEQPHRVSAPIRRYEWPAIVPNGMLLDSDHGRWLLYYRTANHDRYGAMAAGIPGARADVCGVSAVQNVQPPMSAGTPEALLQRPVAP